MDITSKVKYEHQGQKPGVRALYRIRAKRADKATGYGNIAGVYQGL